MGMDINESTGNKGDEQIMGVPAWAFRSTPIDADIECADFGRRLREAIPPYEGENIPTKAPTIFDGEIRQRMQEQRTAHWKWMKQVRLWETSHNIDLR